MNTDPQDLYELGRLEKVAQRLDEVAHDLEDDLYIAQQVAQQAWIDYDSLFSRIHGD